VRAPVPFDRLTYPWNALDGLLKDGRRLYQEVQATMNAFRLKPASTMRGARGKRVSLKERDPW